MSVSQVEWNNSHVQVQGLIQPIGGMAQMNNAIDRDRDRDRTLHGLNSESLVGVGGDVKNAFGKKFE